MYLKINFFRTQMKIFYHNKIYYIEEGIDEEIREEDEDKEKKYYKTTFRGLIFRFKSEIEKIIEYIEDSETENENGEPDTIIIIKIENNEGKTILRKNIDDSYTENTMMKIWSDHLNILPEYSLDSEKIYNTVFIKYTENTLTKKFPPEIINIILKNL